MLRENVQRIIITMDFLRSVNIAPLDATPHQLFAKDFVPQVSIILKLFHFIFIFKTKTKIELNLLILCINVIVTVMVSQHTPCRISKLFRIFEKYIFTALKKLHNIQYITEYLSIYSPRQLPWFTQIILLYIKNHEDIN